MQTNNTNKNAAGVAGQPTGDDALIMRCDQSVRKTRRNEIQIIRRIISALQDAGYKVRGYEDGEQSGFTAREILDFIYQFDEAHISATKPGSKSSFVFFIFTNGNEGRDVASDYGTSLEPVLSPVWNWLDEMEATGRI